MGSKTDLNHFNLVRGRHETKNDFNCSQCYEENIQEQCYEEDHGSPHTSAGLCYKVTWFKRPFPILPFPPHLLYFSPNHYQYLILCQNIARTFDLALGALEGTAFAFIISSSAFSRALPQSRSSIYIYQMSK